MKLYAFTCGSVTGPFRDGGAQIIYGHDPDQWAALPHAPAALGEPSAVH